MSGASIDHDDDCEVCKLTGQDYRNAGPLGVQVSCKRCGTFTWNPLVFCSPPKSREHQVQLSAFIQDQNAAGIVPHLIADLVDQVKRIPIPRLQERSLRALAAMAGEVGNDIQHIHRFGLMLKIQAVSYCADEDELWFLTCILEQEGFVKLREHGYVNLTIKGISKSKNYHREEVPTSRDLLRCLLMPQWTRPIH